MSTMTRGTRLLLLGVALLASLAVAQAAGADELRIAIVQAQAGDARKYQALLEYLSKRGVPASFVKAPDYRAAADLFAAGQVDAMFSASGIAGAMMIKGLADPLVRPVSQDGISTYSAVVVAPSGAPKFDHTGRYFNGKRVIFAALASAGEVYLHALGPSKPAALLKAASHSAAIDAVSRGQADVAIVKNTVWANEKANYPVLTAVGVDSGENPDNTLIVSKKIHVTVSQRLSTVLLGLKADGSPEAAAARKALKIQGFIPTTAKDFAHTLNLLKRAGVTKDFGFTF